MAFAYANRVLETSTTTGTGTYDLAGAVVGHQTFVAGIGTANLCYYTATDGTDWEVGIGTVTDAATDTLARTTIVKSSNANAAVNWGSGTKNIFCTIPANGTWDIGDIKASAKASAGSGWLLCYGQAVSRTTYAALFAEISTTYGVGDGTTTFNIPDLRGRVIAGQDDMGGSSANRLTGVTGSVDGDTLGGTGGTETHTLSTAEMPAHTHTVERAAAAVGTSRVTSTSTSSAGTITSSSTGGGGAHNNVQPTIILNYMIFAGV